MKPHLLTLAILGAFSGIAAAQSSVTLYGVADVAVEHIKGATSSTRMVSGQQQGSRWGLRGSENLGGGLKAVYQLESGFNIATGASGQGGLLFGRQAYVGLAGNFGAVRLGRQYSPMDDIASVIGTKTYDILSVVPIIGNGDYNRVNNAVTYLSPSMNGLTVQAQYSLGEQRPASDASEDFGKQYSAHALYASGPWTAGLAYMKVIDANGSTAGKQGQNAVLLAGSYSVGAIKLSAYYDVEDKAAEKLKVMGLAVAYKFGETTVSAGAAKAINVNGSAAASSDDATLVTLQASHNLSKRTALYAHVTTVSNDEAAALGFNKPAAGSSSSGVQIGLRHRF